MAKRSPRPSADPAPPIEQHESTTSADGKPSALVVYLTDPAIQAAIDAFVATAPRLTESQRIRLARLLRTHRCTYQHRAA